MREKQGRFGCLLSRHLLAIILTLVFCSSAFAFDPNQEDKQKHMGVSAVIASATYAGAREYKYSRTASAFMSLALAALIGHNKEATDYQYDHEDMQANMIGASVGLMIPLSFDF